MAATKKTAGKGKENKGKEKKLLRKAETAKAQQLKALLSQLNEAGNALEDYPAFSKYERNGLAAVLRFYRGGELPPAVLHWAFGLTKQHMQALYEGCPGWGWSDADKRQELAHPDARFICVFAASAAAAPQGASTAAPLGEEQPGSGSEQAAAGDAAEGEQQQQQEEPLAFMHFRWEEEAGEAVLYLYEIQIQQRAQGKGLGKFLMQLLELMGRKARVARLMLTVFHGNAAARGLYSRLGYTLDEDSPGAADPATTATYDILTKWLKPRAA